MLSSIPQRGFSQPEFEQRAQKAQRMMNEEKLDAILLTTEPNVRYFSGFLTQFWHCLLYTSPSPRDRTRSRMPSSA